MFKFILMFISFFVGCFLIKFLSHDPINISDISSQAFLLSLAMKAIPYIQMIFEILDKHINEKKPKDKNTLTSFNDAVAKELIKINSNLVKINLKNENYGDDILPPLRSRESYETPWEWSHARACHEFLHMWRLCFQYPSSFVCDLYKAPNNSWAKIIIVLGDISPEDICLERCDFDSDMLRALHSTKVYSFKKGMTVPIIICEPDEIDDPAEERRAKILSVNKKTKDYRCDSLTLEINLNNRGDIPRFSDNNGKIIRTIEIRNNKYCHLILDDEDDAQTKSLSLTKPSAM